MQLKCYKSLNTYIIIKGNNSVLSTNVHQYSRVFHRTHKKLFAINNNQILHLSCVLTQFFNALNFPHVEDVSLNQNTVILLVYLYLSRGWNWTLRMGDGNRKLLSHSAVTISHIEAVLSVAALSSFLPFRLQLIKWNVWAFYNYVSKKATSFVKKSIIITRRFIASCKSKLFLLLHDPKNASENVSNS